MLFLRDLRSFSVYMFHQRHLQSVIFETNIRIITIKAFLAFSHMRWIMTGLYGDECYHEAELTEVYFEEKFWDTLEKFDNN